MTDELVERLRAAGCVFAEDEADALRTAFSGEALETAVARRIEGSPLEQVLGFAAIGDVRVDLGPGVFVPRARATAIAEIAAARRPDARIVVDLGCGAGTLAAILATRLAAHIIGTEVDPVAMSSARRTARRYGFEVAEGSWWSPLPSSWRGRVDLAVAYLPHVPTGQLHRIHADFRAHEPEVSVDGGPDGLDPWRAVAQETASWLTPGGLFVTLIAPEQRTEALRIGEDADLDVEYEESDDDLVLLAHRPGHR
ncbi:methyltransferase domain-containing protein [Aeromicrobium sp. YIM 150415]|uniref:methyltransferase domain-containing protein n=1 Tax=Aeromicrobium sp. YIM 150415 TaxID=2803912 RepID=UPI00196278AC|nr:methyltransferase domain-containing protein [Aeromicrobium sp. YIM 150415]MBM9465067.1 methyltransferase domain-containing protein [Aeromicrobium sp. YIM 150415]